ncbi:MAG TPA: hypothetical protein VEA59_02020 [Patescibacteria group bacterium]|nr:hypothetical protein [Patescibacteria group bacterium]
MQVKSITHEGAVIEYVGLPIVAYMNTGENWGGRGNILTGVEGGMGEIAIGSLPQAFWWQRNWKSRGQYVCGFVLDLSRRFIYYDTPEALDFALDHLRRLGFQTYPMTHTKVESWDTVPV